MSDHLPYAYELPLAWGPPGARDAALEALRLLPASELRLMDALWLAEALVVHVEGGEVRTVGARLRAIAGLPTT